MGRKKAELTVFETVTTRIRETTVFKIKQVLLHKNRGKKPGDKIAQCDYIDSILTPAVERDFARISPDGKGSSA